MSETEISDRICSLSKTQQVINFLLGRQCSTCLNLIYTDWWKPKTFTYPEGSYCKFVERGYFDRLPTELTCEHWQIK